MIYIINHIQSISVSESGKPPNIQHGCFCNKAEIICLNVLDSKYSNSSDLLDNLVSLFILS